MRKDVLKKFKMKAGSPEMLKDEMHAQVDKIKNTDEDLFNGLEQIGLSLKLSLFREMPINKEQDESALKECTTMIYTFMRALADSGFIRIVPKEERIAESVLENFIKNI
jgi:hypothetical protein